MRTPLLVLVLTVGCGNEKVGQDARATEAWNGQYDLTWSCGMAPCDAGPDCYPTACFMPPFAVPDPPGVDVAVISGAETMSGTIAFWSGNHVVWQKSATVLDNHNELLAGGGDLDGTHYVEAQVMRATSAGFEGEVSWRAPQEISTILWHVDAMRAP